MPEIVGRFGSSGGKALMDWVLDESLKVCFHDQRQILEIAAAKLKRHLFFGFSLASFLCSPCTNGSNAVVFDKEAVVLDGLLK